MVCFQDARSEADCSLEAMFSLFEVQGSNVDGRREQGRTECGLDECSSRLCYEIVKINREISMENDHRNAVVTVQEKSDFLGNFAEGQQ